ncbi:MAG: hypothetical protein LBT22_02910 [Peptococcaceae bacterium]|jgi:hypothetical protein|nr:hypothetical protein [Peptococcaceae bacterium]
MMMKSIADRSVFNIWDEESRTFACGCMQQWYTTEWKRRAGCGPSVASNLLLYLNQTRSSIDLGDDFTSRERCLRLMEEVWEFVTPKIGGVSTTKRFYTALEAYLQAKALQAAYDFCNVPVQKAKRPALDEVLGFIGGALAKDVPVAFLNLCNGQEKDLDQWHWVTIIALEYTEDKRGAEIEFLDEGKIWRINLASWYATTTLGGGFVCFNA